MMYDKLISITIVFCVLMSGCEKAKDIDDCVYIYYKELNAGTFSVIVTEGPYGANKKMLFGKYIRNDDGTIKLTNGGNVRERRGLEWYTVKIDPNHPSKYPRVVQ